MRARRSKRWLKEHRRDHYVRRARDANYRARAVYKLQEIDERDKLLRPGGVVVDLGAAPGSWSQYAAFRVGPTGRVLAVDVLEMDPVAGVHFIRGDFTEDAVFRRCLDYVGDHGADLVISDIAPNLSGIRATDQARSMHLAELAYEFAARVLKPGGDLLVKLFEGPETDAYRRQLVERFQRVMIRKPRASRDASREFYVLARGYEV